MSIRRRSDHLVYVVHGLEHAFAQVTRLVAVAKLYGLVLAGGSPAGYNRAAPRPAHQCYFSFYRWISARVQNFARMNHFDFCHSDSLLIDVGASAPDGFS